MLHFGKKVPLLIEKNYHEKRILLEHKTNLSIQKQSNKLPDITAIFENLWVEFDFFY